MAQVDRKWLADRAVSPLKIGTDNTSPFQFFNVGIEIQHGPWPVVSAYPTVRIGTTTTDGISVYNPTSSAEIILDSSSSNQPAGQSYRIRSDSTGSFVISDIKAASDRIILAPSGDTVFSGSINVASIDTTSIQSTSPITIQSPSSITLQTPLTVIERDATIGGDATVNGNLNVYKSVNGDLVYGLVRNTNSIGMGSGAEVAAIVGDTTVGMKTVGAVGYVGTLSNYDLKIVRDGDTAIWVQTDGDGNPLLNVGCPTTLLNDTTATGNLDVVKTVDLNVLRGIVENTGTGLGTGAEVTSRVSGKIAGSRVTIQPVGTDAQLGTFSNDNVALVRNGTESMVLTSSEVNVYTNLSVRSGYLTMLTGDATVQGNLEVSNNVKIGGPDFRVDRDLNSDTVAGMIRNGGTIGQEAKMLVIGGDATVGMRYLNMSGMGPEAKIGTFSDDGLNIVRNDVVAIAITTDGDGNPKLNATGCPTSVLADATVNGNLAVANDATVGRNLEVLDRLVVTGTGTSPLKISGGGGHIAERNYIDSMTGDLYLRAQPATAINSCQISLDGTNITLAAVGTVTADVGDHFEVYGDATIGNNLMVGNDATVNGNLEVLDHLVVTGTGTSSLQIKSGGGHLADRIYIDSLTGHLVLRAQPATAFPDYNQISLDGTNVDVRTNPYTGMVTLYPGVFGSAVVSGDATVTNNLMVGNDATVSNNFRVLNDATINENFMVLNDATVGRNFQVSNEIRILGDLYATTFYSATAIAIQATNSITLNSPAIHLLGAVTCPADTDINCSNSLSPGGNIVTASYTSPLNHWIDFYLPSSGVSTVPRLRPSYSTDVDTNMAWTLQPFPQTLGNHTRVMNLGSYVTAPNEYVLISVETWDAFTVSSYDWPSQIWAYGKIISYTPPSASMIINILYINVGTTSTANFYVHPAWPFLPVIRQQQVTIPSSSSSIVTVDFTPIGFAGPMSSLKGANIRLKTLAV